MAIKSASGEQNQLSHFGGGADPKPGDDNTERSAAPPPEDGTGTDPLPPVNEGDQRADNQPPAPPEKPKPSGFDDARAKIGERFAAKRAEQTTEFNGDLNDPQTLYGNLGKPAADDGDDAAAGDAPPQPSAKPAVSADTGAIELKVDGKTLKKSVDEIAVLADMTPDEVRADPARAQRYAQREIASDNRLEEAKKIKREAQERAARVNADDEQPPARRPAANQPPTGEEEEDGSGQPSDTSPTSGDVDFEKLAETIMVEDPKKAGQALREAFAQESEKSARRVVSETDTRNRLIADRNSTASALQEFIGDHKELEGNRYMASAITAALHDEYRDDLVNALEAEGRSRDEAEEIVQSVTPAQLADAHLHRRLNRDPNVRSVSKAMMDQAYDRVKTGLNVTTQQQPSREQPRQDLSQQRHERKASLPQQPRRASVPPATPAAPKAPMTRSQAVADIRGMRGQKK